MSEKSKVHKLRLYPTRHEKVVTAKITAKSRFVFKHFLAIWNETYKMTEKGLSCIFCSGQLLSLKVELHWLKEAE